ncbi:PREDICTED: isoamyl acetate-hydrolyzing esterase 1 homolog isoform X3 [Miniopterus natalensis]|uniref:isoamyl acetate-hydrolyzing esterase 1 homolog isoform X3 n=1 Tax=Miniopterus natalensis TaxID=291302 RepID=UPI0007A6B6F8|nr:PREDICTED: isoamyl acetate-hydrolyzing esterase 1 homolog isoform X3 [Miniopterus natalensis]
MVQYLKSLDIPESRLVLITPPPLCEAAWEKECLAQGCKLNRLNSVVGEYANACLHVAQDCGTDVLDLWALMQKDGQVEWLAWSFWDVANARATTHPEQLVESINGNKD